MCVSADERYDALLIFAVNSWDIPDDCFEYGKKRADFIIESISNVTTAEDCQRHCQV